MLNACVDFSDDCGAITPGRLKFGARLTRMSKLTVDTSEIMYFDFRKANRPSLEIGHVGSKYPKLHSMACH
jgi:hypothetical protein